MKRTYLRRSIVLVTLLTLFTLGSISTISLAQQAASTEAEGFEWSAELVALDAAAHTVTVKARVPSSEAFPEFESLKTGERVMLTWSGVDKYSDGIRSVTRYDAARKPLDKLMFPAEFLSFYSSPGIATIKVPIPAADVSEIQSVKPGEWIRAMSPHGNEADMHPISSIHPYNSGF